MRMSRANSCSTRSCRPVSARGRVPTNSWRSCWSRTTTRRTSRSVRGRPCASRGTAEPGPLGSHRPPHPREAPPRPDGHDGGFDVAVDAGLAAELHTLGRIDVADDLALDQHHAGSDRGVHDALLADDEAVVRDDLPAETAVQHQRTAERVLPLDLRPFVNERSGIALVPVTMTTLLPPHRRCPAREGLPLSELLSPHLLFDRDDLPRDALIHLGHVAVEEAALRDHERVGLDVAGDAARLRDLHVPGGDHVALVVAHDDRVHRLDVRVDDALLADDQLAPDVHLAAHLTLDLDRVGDVELALHPRVVAHDG